MHAGHIFTLSITLLATPALAQTDHHDHDDPMSALTATMEPMMASMHGMESSGDADADFLRMMIPHHQSAIDMAQVVLRDGDDPATQDMARAIIRTQEREIADMKAMLDRLGVEAPE